MKFYFVFHPNPIQEFETLIADPAKVVDGEITVSGIDLTNVRNFFTTLKTSDIEATEANGKIQEKAIFGLLHEFELRCQH